MATDLFQDLTPAALGSLLPAVRRRGLARGEYFYRTGEISIRLWILISGQGKMSVPSADGDETVLDVVLPGQTFGLPGLFSSDRHRIGETVATEPSVALSIERDALAAFLELHPEAMRRTLTRLSDLVREYAEAMALAAHEDLRGRVARRLLDLAAMHGRPGPGGVRIGARVSQDVLGSMIGASRAKVNRALGMLADAGHVRVEAGTITLLNPGRLRREHPDRLPDPQGRPTSRGA